MAQKYSGRSGEQKNIPPPTIAEIRTWFLGRVDFPANCARNAMTERVSLFVLFLVQRGVMLE
jgi:hypothetical protein